MKAKHPFSSDDGWTILDTVVALFVFAVAVAVTFMLANNVANYSTNRSPQFLFLSRVSTADTILNRLVGLAGEGLPSSRVTDPSITLSLSAYNESPSDFSVSNGYAKPVDGNNDTKNGFGYLVVRGVFNIASLNPVRWAVVRYDSKTSMDVLSSGGSLPSSGDCVSILSLSDEELESTAILKSSMAAGDGEDPSAYGLPSLRSGEYAVFRTESCTVPYDRVDVVLTGGVPSYCADGTYNLSLVYYNSDGSSTIVPLVNCTAGFKVKFLVDSNGTYRWVDDLTGMSAFEERKELRAVALFYAYQKSHRHRSPVSNCTTDAYILTSEGKVGYSFDLSSVKDCKDYMWGSSALVVPVKLEILR